jgi:hypothetical protein
MRRPRAAVAQERIEAEQQDGARRILRFGVPAIQELVAPPSIELLGIEARHLEAEMERDPGELKDQSKSEQRAERKLLLSLPDAHEARRGDREGSEHPDARAGLAGGRFGSERDGRDDAQERMRPEHCCE